MTIKHKFKNAANTYNFFKLKPKKIKQKEAEKVDWKKKFIPKFTIFDISISGVLLAMHIIVMIFAKWTILRVVPIELEFIFYVLYGLILGPFKGMFLAIIGDTLTLLLTGSIGTWFWLYAIIPPLITLFSGYFIIWFNKSMNFRRYAILPILLVSYAIILTVFFLRVNPDLTVNVSKTKQIPALLMLMFLGIYGLFLLISLALMFYFARTKKSNKMINYLLVFSLIAIVIIIFRWILGPVAYIEWFNYIRKSKPNAKLKTYGVDYLIVMYPIILKTAITLPIYVAVLAPIFRVLLILKDKFNSKNMAKMKY